MKETKMKEIKNIIVSKENLQVLFNYINNLYLESLKIKKGLSFSFPPSFSFKVFCEDDTICESENDEFLQAGDIIDLKKCKEIVLNYTELGKSISLSLKHGDKYNHSDFTVRGEDRDWVNGKFNKLNEIINSFEKQDSIFIQHKTIFLHFIAFSIGLVFFGFMISTTTTDSNPDKTPLYTFIINYPYLKYIITIILIWFIGLMFASIIRDWFLNKFFPVIEFNFGPEYTKIEKKRRMHLYAVISLFLLPFGAILYDFVKSFLTK